MSGWFVLREGVSPENSLKRNRRIMHYLHTAIRRIIDLVVEEGIGTLIVGKNPLWKQRVELGKKHNQEFVQIPHARFIDTKVPISCDADATTEQEMRALFLLLPRQWLISWMS